MKKNKTPDPIQVSLFRANAVAPRAQKLADLLEQFWLARAVPLGLNIVHTARRLSKFRPPMQSELDEQFDALFYERSSTSR